MHADRFLASETWFGCGGSPSVPEDLSGHDEAGGLRADLDVARQQPHVRERVLEVSELLIGQGLDGRGVDRPMGGRERESLVRLDGGLRDEQQRKCKKKSSVFKVFKSTLCTLIN